VVLAGWHNTSQEQPVSPGPARLAHPPNQPTHPPTHLVVALVEHAGACSPHRLDSTLRQRGCDLQQESRGSWQSGGCRCGRARWLFTAVAAAKVVIIKSGGSNFRVQGRLGRTLAHSPFLPPLRLLAYSHSMLSVLSPCSAAYACTAGGSRKSRSRATRGPTTHLGWCTFACSSLPAASCRAALPGCPITAWPIAHLLAAASPSLSC
jgi:hypothetical protein